MAIRACAESLVGVVDDGGGHERMKPTVRLIHPRFQSVGRRREYCPDDLVQAVVFTVQPCTVRVCGQGIIDQEERAIERELLRD